MSIHESPPSSGCSRVVIAFSREPFMPAHIAANKLKQHNNANDPSQIFAKV
jgi:hypothetical protein